MLTGSPPGIVAKASRAVRQDAALLIVARQPEGRAVSGAGLLDADGAAALKTKTEWVGGSGAEYART